MVNVLDKLPKKLQGQARRHLQDIVYARFPDEHWRHLRTINVVESPFAGLRLRTEAAKRYKKVENAMAVIWKMLLLAEQRFHRLGTPEKLMQVYLESGFRERNEETETKQEEVLTSV
jgi:transposase-like protein